MSTRHLDAKKCLLLSTRLVAIYSEMISHLDNPNMALIAIVMILDQIIMTYLFHVLQDFKMLQNK